GYVTLLNNMQWTSATSTNATIERTKHRKNELLADPATALLAETYNRAVENLERIKADEPIRCTIPDSTACKRYKNETLPRAKKTLEQATTPYQEALDKATREAKKETTPVAPDQSLIIRTFLPMLGGIFVMLGSK